MKKTEERPDYCQHFIYMKVLQKAVKKIAWGFPQLLLTTAWRGKHKKMSWHQLSKRYCKFCAM